jgi:hypothetical protein
MLYVACCTSYGARCMVHVVRCMLCVACCTLHVACCTQVRGRSSLPASPACGGRGAPSSHHPPRRVPRQLGPAALAAQRRGHRRLELQRLPNGPSLTGGARTVVLEPGGGAHPSRQPRPRVGGSHAGHLCRPVQLACDPDRRVPRDAQRHSFSPPFPPTMLHHPFRELLRGRSFSARTSLPRASPCCAKQTAAIAWKGTLPRQLYHCCVLACCSGKVDAGLQILRRRRLQPIARPAVHSK